MKTVSLILRIVAILGAAACVALWFNTKGIIKQATNDMQGVEGELLVHKSAKIPGILEDKATAESNLRAANTRITELDANLKKTSDALTAEKNTTTKLSREKLEESQKARKTQVALDETAKKLETVQADLDATRKELIEQKETQQDTKKIDDLNRKYNILETQHATLQKEYEIAKKKADIFDISEIVETVSIDEASGTKTITKTLRIPYVVEGKTAVITRVEKAKKNEMIALNRGKDDGLDIAQKIILRLDGEYIASIQIEELGKDFAVATVSLKDGTPEVIEVGDVYELVPTVELKKDAPKAEATEGAEAVEAAAPVAAPDAE